MTRLQPSAASACAMPRPMPEVDPVMTAIRLVVIDGLLKSPFVILLPRGHCNAAEIRYPARANIAAPWCSEIVHFVGAAPLAERAALLLCRAAGAARPERRSCEHSFFPGRRGRRHVVTEQSRLRRRAAPAARMGYFAAPPRSNGE